MAGGDLVRRRFRVGLVVLVSIIAFGIGVFMVGQRASLFTRKVDYLLRFDSASGLTTGNSVRLAGVTVGNVVEVSLSEKPGDTTVTVTISVERRMTSRIRTDTRAEIKTIGLLGDKYIELTGGTEAAPVIPPGGEIPAKSETGIEKLLAGGEGLLEDLTSIAQSLKVILGRVEAGQGFLGELTTTSEQSEKLGSNVNRALQELTLTLRRVNEGKSLAGRLLVNEKYGKETGDALTQAVNSAARLFGKLAGSFEKSQGALPALLDDPQGKQKVYRLIDNLSQAALSLAQVSSELQSGKGVLPTLLHDKEFGAKFRHDLESLTAHLNSISRKLDEGDGTIGKLINDPSLYDAANDVVVGVNDSKLLKWLVQNRQKAGIEDRYKKEKAKSTQATPPPPQ
jgi:phospholipid/cholesterol/gamma-HCH transport system substrate-binding protein